MTRQYDIAVVGAGFTGLSAAHSLAKNGYRVKLIEQDGQPGGLAGSFKFGNGVTVEKFYHHWFNSDAHIALLAKELGAGDQILTLRSSNSMYYNQRFWRLSSPLDLLKFTPLSLWDRMRLGLLVLSVRLKKNWKKIERLSIREWLEPLCGPNTFKVVWEPLVRSKFSVYADRVNAVWMWKKLSLRGSTRDRKGIEQLSYFKGGFGQLASCLVDEIRKNDSDVVFNTQVTGVSLTQNRIACLNTSDGPVTARQYLFTPALPIIHNIFRQHGQTAWLRGLCDIKYLGNICLVLQLHKRLSDTYWINVNEVGFPFVGIIEHTNLDDGGDYQGSHIVYLSKYVACEDPIWRYGDEEYLRYALKPLKRMFPKLQDEWIIDYRIWRAEYAQPITSRGYSSHIPTEKTPYANGWISTMAQIYPEDRGTNYAVREGRAIAAHIHQQVQQKDM